MLQPEVWFLNAKTFWPLYEQYIVAETWRVLSYLSGILVSPIVFKYLQLPIQTRNCSWRLTCEQSHHPLSLQKQNALEHLKTRPSLKPIYAHQHHYISVMERDWAWPAQRTQTEHPIRPWSNSLISPLAVIFQMPYPKLFSHACPPPASTNGRRSMISWSRWGPFFCSICPCFAWRLSCPWKMTRTNNHHVNLVAQ